jgi:short-subunit dehydrogenase
LVDCIPADLSFRDSPEKIYKFCESKGYSIEILVNNAGYAIPDPFHLSSIDVEEKFLRVLSTSVIALTKLFLKDMIKNKKGKIMIISSVAAFAPPSTIQFLYGPVKTFMNRFSEGINISYNQIGITSTAVCPGYTITNFHSSSGIQYEMDRVPKFLKKDSKRIAEIAVNATLNGKRVCIPTKTYKVIVFLLNIIPKSLFSAVNHYFSPGRYDKKF